MAAPVLPAIVCLGPEGSFSHLVARQRFPDRDTLALASIGEVFDHLVSHPESEGIVPIENSSGGFIIETVDRLVHDGCPLHITEELTLDVKLALMGHAGQPVDVIYSHPMPFFHSDEWLKSHYPDARRNSLASTSLSAQAASLDMYAATIGPRSNVTSYGLDLLHFPIAGEVPNITQFFVVSHVANAASEAHNRTALVAELPDRPGSLCAFLQPFSDGGVSLKRIQSRPLRGQPNKYRFYIELEGSPAQLPTQQALEHVQRDGAQVRLLGSYSTGKRFDT